MNELAALASNVGMDLAFAGILIGGIYRKVHGNREYVFTYILFNLVTLALCLLLRRVQMELGFALGLFAVFGVLRYRTEAIRIIDLTYLFVAIGIAMLNGIAGGRVSVAELLLVNGLIVGLTAVMELGAATRSVRSLPMLYDNLTLLGGSKAALIADIRERTNLDVLRVEVTRVDLLRDSAEVRVYFRPRASEEEVVDEPANAPTSVRVVPAVQGGGE